MTRIDVHRPSAIVPAEYEYVAPEKLDREDADSFELLAHFRKTIRDHMERTGGTYSRHEHGGNCMVCGSPNAIYTVLFYHAETNTYIRMGRDCAEQIDMGGWQGDFRRLQRAVKDVRAREKGIKKAKAVLAEKELTACWDVYTMREEARKRWERAYDEQMRARQREWDAATPKEQDAILEREDREGFLPPALEEILERYEERVISDMVSKLIRYGSASEKQFGYMRVLLDKIARREEVAAQRAAEKEVAEDAPNGRVEFEGEVIKVDWQENDFGSRRVFTIKTTKGWLAWGTVPTTLWDVCRGDRVRVKATVEPSKRDAKFGLFKRPVGEILERKEAE